MKNKSQNSNKTTETPVGNNSTKSEFKTLVIQGDEYKTLLTKKYNSRTKWQKPNEKLISSFIPGTVNEILVKEGQLVKKGDKIMILEAMKMLNTIEININGKIKKIHVNVGDRVSKGRLMIEID